MPVPPLPGEFSEEFRDFLGCCLIKNPLQRPSSLQLMVLLGLWDYNEIINS